VADQEAISQITRRYTQTNMKIKKLRPNNKMPNGGGLVPAGTQHPRADDKQMISHKEAPVYLDEMGPQEKIAVISPRWMANSSNNISNNRPVICVDREVTWPLKLRV